MSHSWSGSTLYSSGEEAGGIALPKQLPLQRSIFSNGLILQVKQILKPIMDLFFSKTRLVIQVGVACSAWPPGLGVDAFLE